MPTVNARTAGGRYVISTPSTPLDGRALAAAEGATAVELPTGDDRARVWMIL
jgi:hypothetical protein